MRSRDETLPKEGELIHEVENPPNVENEPMLRFELGGRSIIEEIVL
jgi:hypothetical protein